MATVPQPASKGFGARVRRGTSAELCNLVTVRIYPRAFRELQDMGALEELAPGIHALSPHYGHLYDPLFGLMTNDKSLALLLV
jgi:hypothetical protein